jgi:hypothetical protein
MDQNQDQTQDQNQNDQNRSASDKGDSSRDKGMIPKSRFDEVNTKRKEAEAELASVAEGLKAEVPEEYLDLVPDLPPAALIKWLRVVSQKGFFSKAPLEAPDGGKRPNQKSPQNLDGLSPLGKMALGYGPTKK